MVFTKLTVLLPSIVFILYFITSMSYLYKRDYAWTIVWFGYALAQIGLIIAGERK